MKSLTMQGCFQRRDRLIGLSAVDLIIISNPRHIQYLTGLFISPIGLGSWGSDFLLIDTRTGKSTLLLHSFVDTRGIDIHVDELLIWDAYSLKTPGAAALHTEGLKRLNRNLKQRRFHTVGIEAGFLPFGTDVVNTVDMTPLLLELRREKDQDELDLIKEGICAIEAGHRTARETIQPGISELDMYNSVMAAIVNKAGSAILPMGDLLSGSRTTLGGGAVSNRILQKGELMILDLFPLVNGYKGDFTATLSVDGTLSGKQKSLESALISAMKAGEGMLKPGVTGSVVYNAVLSELTQHGFGEGFSHHAGHGLGLGHPEAPFFLPESKDVLRVGDVVTLEPGSYSAEQDFGARIERNYLITEDGAVILSGHDLAFI